MFVKCWTIEIQDSKLALFDLGLSVSKRSGSQFQVGFILKSVSNHSSIHNLEGIFCVEFETFKSLKAWWLIISKWSPFETALLPRFRLVRRVRSQVGHTKWSKLSFEHQQKGKSNMMKDTKRTSKRTCTKLQTCCKWLYLYQGKTKQRTNFQQTKMGHKQSICTSKRSCSIKLWKTPKIMCVCTSPTNLQEYMVSKHISLHCCMFKTSISQNLSSTCLTAVFMSNSNSSLCRCLCYCIACYCHDAMLLSHVFTLLCVHPSTPNLLLSLIRGACISNSALNLKKKVQFQSYTRTWENSDPKSYSTLLVLGYC